LVSLPQGAGSHLLLRAHAAAKVAEAVRIMPPAALAVPEELDGLGEY